MSQGDYGVHDTALVKVEGESQGLIPGSVIVEWEMPRYKDKTLEEGRVRFIVKSEYEVIIDD